MRVHILQHVLFEDIGNMALWLEKSGADLTYTRFFENTDLPRMTGLDLIIIMGGPMSVNDESALPWLSAEKGFIRDAVELGVPVIGVCLGAQLIASALGARVYQNPQKEIGWFLVEATHSPMNTFSFPEKCMVLHWHGETFDLPIGAVQLARSEVCENQAFQIGRNVIGLQFHLESTPESVESIINHCGDELVSAQYVQSASELRMVDNAVYIQINSLIDDVLSYLLGGHKT